MNELRFRPNRTFTIVQFTDLHWRNGDPSDLRTRALMHRVLDIEQPDMVVLSGDVIDGSECADPARSWCEAVAELDERAVPWAAVFGNHDDEGLLNREQLMAVQQQCSHCLSQRGSLHLPGVGNYTLDILGSKAESVAAKLYFLDSGGLSTEGDGGYAWITEAQINWCLGMTHFGASHDSAGPSPTSGDSAPPSLVFFHIPIPEFDEFSRRGWFGNKLEEVCGPTFNSGLFSALSTSRSVLGIFVGHDHLNDFEVERNGIRLCYGRCTGYGGYGRDDFSRGARVIQLIEGERSFQSWIRLDEGNAVN